MKTILNIAVLVIAFALASGMRIQLHPFKIIFTDLQQVLGLLILTAGLLLICNANYVRGYNEGADKVKAVFNKGIEDLENKYNHKITELEKDKPHAATDPNH